MSSFMNMRQKGSTLVELIVSITLFLTVISIMIPTLFTTIKMQRNVNSFVRMHNSLSYSMEYIAKELRTGKKFRLDLLLPTKSKLVFTNYHNEVVTYQFDSERHTLTRQIDLQSPFALVSSDVVLNKFEFWVNNKNPANEEKQISVVILANASPADGITGVALTGIATQFQTTVTPLLRSDVQ